MAFLSFRWFLITFFMHPRNVFSQCISICFLLTTYRAVILIFRLNSSKNIVRICLIFLLTLFNYCWISTRTWGSRGWWTILKDFIIKKIMETFVLTNLDIRNESFSNVFLKFTSLLQVIFSNLLCLLECFSRICRANLLYGRRWPQPRVHSIA